jgi:transcriptional regulator with XRE-family HTH domain
MHKHLAEARIAKGLTQAEVAAAIGRDQSLVSRYETGKSRVDLDTAPKLASVLGIDLITVLYGRAGSEGPGGQEDAPADQGVSRPSSGDESPAEAPSTGEVPAARAA